MRKRIFMTLLGALLLLLLVACSGKQTEQSADFSVQDAMDAMLAQAPVDDPLTLGEGDMLDFFGIQSDSMEQFAAVTCANGISAQEIVLVKAKSDEDAKTVEQQLQKRLDSRMAEAKDYLPDQYAILEQCVVERNGCYVSLIISPEAEALTQLYHEYTTGSRN
jgi:hypothetical protein